ncbi:MAG: TRAP transporter substrate-binding protein [Sandaracinaceae bacterium]|nr:TRAP transporter substrate-binding protein [Sandaracinaceae bacterium]
MSRRRALLSLTFASTLLCALFAASADGPATAQDATQIRMRLGTVAPENTPWEKQLRRLKQHIEAGERRPDPRADVHGRLARRREGARPAHRAGQPAGVRRLDRGARHAGARARRGRGAVPVRQRRAGGRRARRRRRSRSSRPRSDGAASSSASGRRNGFRSWFTKERPIRTPADLQGLRMRSQESEVHLATYRALGASPVAIDVTNVLTSLQTGVVDGFDNTPLFAFATSWYQAAQHLNLSEHSYQPGIVVYSKTWFDGLPADLQQVLTNIPQEITTDGRDQVRRMDPILINNLERFGIKVHRPSAEERAAFAKRSRSVQDSVAGRAGAQGRALLKALRAR